MSVSHPGLQDILVLTSSGWPPGRVAHFVNLRYSPPVTAAQVIEIAATAEARPFTRIIDLDPGDYIEDVLGEMNAVGELMRQRIRAATILEDVGSGNSRDVVTSLLMSYVKYLQTYMRMLEKLGFITGRPVQPALAELDQDLPTLRSIIDGRSVKAGTTPKSDNGGT